MNRRELLLGAAALAALAACGGGSDDDNSSNTTTPGDPGGSTTAPDGTDPRPPAGEIRSARGDVARVAAGNPTGAGAALLPLTVGLYRALAGQEGENLVFSPASVGFALAMTANGAREDTLAEMERVLGASGMAGLNEALNGIDQALESRSGMRQGGFEREAEVTLRLANALWGQDGLRFEDAFLETLGAYYGAGMNLVDYETDAEGARSLINAWVAEQTADRIPELIGDGVLSEATRLVLTNAIYLKAPWLEPFVDGGTKPQPFTLVSGEKVDVDMMQSFARMGGYAKGDGWTAVHLPYIGGELSMTIVIPEEWASFEQALDEAMLETVFGALRPEPFEVHLPKWTTRTAAGLKTVLSDLGMPTAFDPASADFSAMTTTQRLFISAVVHEAFIAVDEEGTEAAAATAVVAAATASVEPPPIVNADRPYLFAVRDLATDTVLFLGRVLDPRG